jgi:AcrR family transcriptional regulator
VNAAVRPQPGTPGAPVRSGGASGGRPLDPELSRAILDATIEVLAEGGYGRLSLEAVAQRAGVHRPAIYRRWPTKVDLVAAAVVSIADVLPDPATGSARDDLVEFVRCVANRLRRDPRSRLGLMLMAELAVDPDLVALVNSRMVWSWRGLLRTIFERGVERGELRRELAPDQLGDVVLGFLYARALSGRPQPNRRESEQFVDTLIEGLRAGPTAPRPTRPRG